MNYGIEPGEQEIFLHGSDFVQPVHQAEPRNLSTLLTP